MPDAAKTKVLTRIMEKKVKTDSRIDLRYVGVFSHPGHYLEWSHVKNLWPYITKPYSSAIRAVDYKLPTCVMIQYGPPIKF